MSHLKDSFSLEGKVALITGGTMGIGEAIVRGLVEMGASVIFTGRNTDLGEKLAVELRNRGAKVTYAKQDVTVEADWHSVLDSVKTDFGRLDILVNNAGILFHKSAEETRLEEFQHLQKVNVDGVFLGCKYAAPLMKRTASPQCRASIINISSAGGLVGMKNLTSYCTSKGAIRLMSKSMASELGESHIRVNSLHPGVIDTHMGDQVKEMLGEELHLGEAEAAAAANALNPLGCTGSPIDVAAAVAFLASQASNFISGAELAVDGGTTSCR